MLREEKEKEEEGGGGKVLAKSVVIMPTIGIYTSKKLLKFANKDLQ